MVVGLRYLKKHATTHRKIERGKETYLCERKLKVMCLVSGGNRRHEVIQFPVRALLLLSESSSLLKVHSSHGCFNALIRIAYADLVCTKRVMERIVTETSH